MEMRIQLISASVGIPKTKLGIDLGSGVYFGFRHTPKSPTILYGLAEESSLGEKVGALGFGYLKTDWFSLLSDKSHKIPVIHQLTGKNVDFNISKKSSHADFKFELFTNNGDVTNSITKINIPASGLLLNTFESRGVLRFIPVKKNFKW